MEAVVAEVKDPAALAMGNYSNAEASDAAICFWGYSETHDDF